MTVYDKTGSIVKYLGGPNVPQVSELFIDRLCMTLDIPKSHHAATIANFKKAEDCGDGEKPKKKVGKYDYSLHLTGDTEEGQILIQCSPSNPSYRFFRIEFNPSKANLWNLKKNINNIVPGGYENLMNTGLVTRIDFTVDISYLDATDIIASHSKIEVESLYAKNGSIESKYLGASSSNHQTLLYDKVAEIVHSNKKKPKGLKSQVPPNKLLRVEYRHLKSYCTLQEHETLKNPFVDLTLIAFPELKSEKQYDPLWTLFLVTCRYKGVKNALSYFNENDKAIYLKRLKAEGKTDWWNPKKIWEGLPAAIASLMNVKSSAPSLSLLT
jgi:hypothetical protein